ncbi:unannotated protein [freshwater metagenome]|uniref:Unannotated protein n=1 Tax=freshwater metagenome TaxID=449393 RepID=A0A6J7G407_9ZZZZ
MCTHGFDVILHEFVALGPVFAGRVRRNLTGLEVSGERHFGIDQNGATSGKTNGHIGANLAALGARRFLRREVDKFEQAGHLDDAPKLCLSPLTLDVVRAQRTGQRLGSGAQFVTRAPAVDKLLGDQPVLLFLLVLHGVDLDGHLMQHLFNGCELGHHACVALLLFNEVSVSLREGIDLGLTLHADGLGLGQPHAHRTVAVLGGTRPAHNPGHEKAHDQTNNESYEKSNDIHGI